MNPHSAGPPTADEAQGAAPHLLQQAEADLALRGQRVLVTRAADQAAAFVEHLRALGAEPLVCPTIRIVAPDNVESLNAALRDIRDYDWLIFTSMNGVRFFMQRLVDLGLERRALAHARVAAIGPVTAEALGSHGMAVDFVPTKYVAETLVDEIGELARQRVLLPQADIARPALAEGLRALGAQVDEVTVYRTVPAGGAELRSVVEQAGLVDIATFTSPSSVQNFVGLLGDHGAAEILGAAIIACIGPITARAAEEVGLEPDVVATDRTVAGLLEAIIRFIKLRRQER